MCVERAVGRPILAGADSHRDRSFDGFDDVGQTDLGRGASEREATAGAAHAAEQAMTGELSHQLLRGGEGDAGFGGKFGRAKARARGTAGGCGHQHDRIIGKVTQAHV
jgi:hypothetical protein